MNLSLGLQRTFFSPQEGLKAAVALNQGGEIPWFGLGVYQLPNDSSTVKLVRSAIAQGYRSIDTAKIYENERSVGEAIRECGVKREEIFVTTKLWNDDMRSGEVGAAFERSLKLLGLDYVDLYLLHWPVKGSIVRSWRVLEKLQRSGRIKAIGVSNHLREHLEELLASAEIVPAVNQIEFHPRLQSRALVEFCQEKGIVVEAWSPLMQGGEVLRDPVLKEIARAHGKTVAQVILRWILQAGVVAIPKSAREERVRENADIFDFALSESEMAAIRGLDRGQRVGPDPASFDF